MLRTTYNWPSLPLHNLLTYCKSYEVKGRKFDWEYKTKYLPKNLLIYTL